MNNKKTILALITILTISLAVRIIAALQWQGLLFDEIASAAVASQPLGQIWTYLRFEMHPPLHFYYLHFWIDLFGQSDASLRLSSVPLGLLAIIAMYLLGRQLYQNPKAGLYAALLTALAATTAFHSIFVRMYALFFLLAALSFYFFLKLINQHNHRSKAEKIYRLNITWLFYFLTSLLALYTHLTALAIPLVQLLWLIYLKRKKLISVVTLKFFIFNFSFLILFYLPWFANFFFQRLLTLGGRAWFFYAEPLELFFLTLPNYFLIGQTTTHYLPIAVFFMIMFIVTYGLLNIHRQGDGWLLTSRLQPAHSLAILIYFVPMIILFTVSLHSWRYYTLSTLGLFLLLLPGLLRLRAKYASLALLVLITVLLSPVFHLISLPPVEWPAIASFIEKREQSGDKIIVAYPTDLLSVKYYYHGNLDIEPFIEPGTKQNYLDDLDLVMRENSIVYASEKTIANFDQLIGDSQRLFFAFDGRILGTTHNLFISWFLENGWQRVDSSSDSPRFNHPQVWLLTRVKVIDK